MLRLNLRRKRSAAIAFATLASFSFKSRETLADESAVIGIVNLFSFSKKRMTGTATVEDKEKARNAFKDTAPALGSSAARAGASTLTAARAGTLANAVIASHLVPAVEEVERGISVLNDENIDFLNATRTGAVDSAAIVALEKRARERMAASANSQPKNDTTTASVIDSTLEYFADSLGGTSKFLYDKTALLAKNIQQMSDIRPDAHNGAKASRWKYSDANGTEACEPINFDGPNWIDDLIKDDIGSAQECKLVAKNVMTSEASYTIKCTYHYEGCTQCVDVAAVNPKSGGVAAHTKISSVRTNLRRVSKDQIQVSWVNLAKSNGTGFYTRCSP